MVAGPATRRENSRSGRHCGCGSSKVVQDCFRLRSRYNCGQCCDVRLLDRLQAAEVFEQAPGSGRTDSRNLT